MQVGYGLFLQSLTATVQVSTASADDTAATANTTDDNATAADARALAELQQWGKQCMMAAAHAAEHSDEAALHASCSMTHSGHNARFEHHVRLLLSLIASASSAVSCANDKRHSITNDSSIATLAYSRTTVGHVAYYLLLHKALNCVQGWH
eukprot:15082-Heterococcus_DN1.PRE.1